MVRHKEARTKPARWEKAAGEMLSWAFSLVGMLFLMMIVIGCIVLDHHLQDLDTVSQRIARDVVVCNSLTEAQKQAEMEAKKLMPKTPVVRNVKAYVQYAPGSEKKWKKGNYLFVTVSVRLRSGLPAVSGTHENSTMTMIEHIKDDQAAQDAIKKLAEADYTPAGDADQKTAASQRQAVNSQVTISQFLAAANNVADQGRKEGWQWDGRTMSCGRYVGTVLKSLGMTGFKPADMYSGNLDRYLAKHHYACEKGIAGKDSVADSIQAGSIVIVCNEKGEPDHSFIASSRATYKNGVYHMDVYDFGSTSLIRQEQPLRDYSHEHIKGHEIHVYNPFTGSDPTRLTGKAEYKYAEAMRNGS